MLYVHEVHTVDGRCEDEFEASYRDGWLPALGGGDDARLLWFLHQAHGTGPSYRVVTITAVRGGDAWERLVARIETGDLRSWAAGVDVLRHDVRAKVLTATEWSPLELDLAAVPVEPADHDHALFMEDTAWPYPGAMEAYLTKAGTQYLDTLRRAEAAGRSLLRLEAAFRPAWGAGRHAEVVLWQRVVRPDQLLPLLTREIPPEHRSAGTWMHDALEVRDRWESRLLRTASWSPLP